MKTNKNDFSKLESRRNTSKTERDSREKRVQRRRNETTRNETINPEESKEQVHPPKTVI